MSRLVRSDTYEDIIKESGLEHLFREELSLR